MRSDSIQPLVPLPRRIARHWALRLVTGRMLQLFWLLPLTALLAFTLVSLAPTDPVEAYVAGQTSLVGPEQRDKIAESLGLDLGFWQRFAIWGSNALSGDLGVSVIFRTPVTEVIAERFMASLTLLAGAWIASALIGFGLGLLAAAYAGRGIDRMVRAIAVVLAASPGFWVAIVLIVVFSVKLGLFPPCCAVPPGYLADEISWTQRLHHMILPFLALSVLGIAPMILHTRAAVIHFLDSPAGQMLMLHGMSQRTAAAGPGVRHALGPSLALHMASIGELFGGTVLVETVFGWPGLGQATVQAILRADVPLIMAVALFTVLLVFTGNLLADLIRQAMDPRLRRPHISPSGR